MFSGVQREQYPRPSGESSSSRYKALLSQLHSDKLLFTIRDFLEVFLDVLRAFLLDVLLAFLLSVLRDVLRDVFFSLARVCFFCSFLDVLLLVLLFLATLLFDL